MLPELYIQGIALATRLEWRARETSLRLYGFRWPTDFLAGFLEQHAAMVRNEQCCCCHCPIHAAGEALEPDLAN